MGPLRLQSAAAISALVAVVVATFCAFVPRTARAQQSSSNSIRILDVATDDADDQAEALTSALQSRLRARSGWSFYATTQPLSVLTAALRCPPQPDPPCLTRIADQLKADRFIWGTMRKVSGQQVSAELHFWTRGTPERIAKETYSDNLKDQNDDTLQKIAEGLVDRLLASEAATLNVNAVSEEGAVRVDGEDRATLNHGRATFEVSAGDHVIEVRGSRGTAKQKVTAIAGTATAVSFDEAAHAPPAEAERGRPFPTRRVAAWTTVGLGVALFAISAVELKGYLNAHDSQSQAELDLAKPSYSGHLSDACSKNTNGLRNTAAGATACNLYSQSVRDSALAWSLGAVGAALVATGIYLFGEKHPSDSAAHARWRLLPDLSPRGGSLGVLGTF